jgi:hypothetical protein
MVQQVGRVGRARNRTKMTPDDSLGRLLRWRLDRAEADAPPPPRAARLLQQIRPWWEVWPERFRAQAQRLGRIEVGFAYAKVDPGQGRSGHPVPTLIAHAEELETFARVVYLVVRDGRLRLRFHLEAMPGRMEDAFEVTFVSEGARPILSAVAKASMNEYRLDTELPDQLAAGWESLKVTDRMPFRFLLRPVTNDT